MKVTNKVNNNISIYAPHTAGGGAAKYINIPAGATLELDDLEWTTFYEKAAQADIKAGGLVITEQAESPLEVKDIVALIKAQAGVIADGRKSKAELQSLAALLGVDLTAKVPEAEDTKVKTKG